MRPIVYSTLAMEMAKAGITNKAIAVALGISIRSFYSRMRGETVFDWDETCIIQNTFFPNVPKEVLFRKEGS